MNKEKAEVPQGIYKMTCPVCDGKGGKRVAFKWWNCRKCGGATWILGEK